MSGQSPRQVWQAKLDYLQIALAKEADPAQRFKLERDIEEVSERLSTLETSTPERASPDSTKPRRNALRKAKRGAGLRVSDGLGPNYLLSTAEHESLTELLGPFANHDRDCLFLLSSFAQGSETTYSSPTGDRLTYRGETISPQDASAAMMVACLVAKLTTPDKLELRTTRNDFDEFNKNIVLIGSSLTNKQTELAHDNAIVPVAHVFGLDPFHIKCQNPECALPKRAWVPNDGEHPSNWQNGDRCRVDYAVVQRLPGLDQSGETGLLVLAGLGPVGTQGAAYFLCHHWRLIHREYGDSPFSIVLQFVAGKLNEPKYQIAKVAHRTDPANPDRCIERPLNPPAKSRSS